MRFFNVTSSIGLYKLSLGRLSKLLALALFGSVSSVQAQDRMINIAAEGEATFFNHQAACTIVSGCREFAVLAEATTRGFDAYVYVIRLDTQERALDNDDWLSLPLDLRNTLVNSVRTPNSVTDSTNLFWVRNLPICVYGAEARRGGSGRVSVQINDITGALGDCRFQRGRNDGNEPGWGLASG